MGERSLQPQGLGLAIGWPWPELWSPVDTAPVCSLGPSLIRWPRGEGAGGPQGEGLDPLLTSFSA